MGACLSSCRKAAPPDGKDDDTTKLANGSATPAVGVETTAKVAEGGVDNKAFQDEKDQDDLIRLQSSMTIMQDDHLKERKLLNEKIAELQSEITFKDKIVEEEPIQQEAPPVAKIEDNLECPDKPLPNPPVSRREDETEEEVKSENEIEEAKNDEKLDEKNASETENVIIETPAAEKSEPEVKEEIKETPAEKSSSSSSSSSSSDENDDGAESKSLKSQQTVKEVVLSEFKVEEVDLNEPPTSIQPAEQVIKSDTEEKAEVGTESDQAKTSEQVAERRGSTDSTLSERDEKLAKLKNIMQESTENLAKLEEKKDDSLNVPDPFASWDSIGAKVEEPTTATTPAITASTTDAFGFADPWGSTEQTPISLPAPTLVTTSIENETTKPLTRKLSSSSSSSSDSSAKEPDGSLEKDIFNTIKKQNSFSSTTFPVEEPTVIAPIELDVPTPSLPLPTPQSPKPTSEQTKNIFDSSDDDEEVEEEKPKEEKATNEIHSMLDMWNKKYDSGTPEPLSIPPPTSVNLIDIDINQTVEEPQTSVEPEPILEAPAFEPILVDPTPQPSPPVDDTTEETETTKKPTVKSETSGMNWDLSSSDDDSNEEKTQISNQKEKVMTTAKMINLDSTDDEVGLTELDTDVEASSVIPDASESTIADNEDRADFLDQATSGYIPAPQVDITSPDVEPPQPHVPSQAAESSSSSDEGLNPFQPARSAHKPSVVSLDEPTPPSIPEVGPEPPITSMTAAPVQSAKYIADGAETGGETDVFSDGDTEAETDAEKVREPMTNTRKSSSSSSNSSWSSSDNEQNL